MKTTLRMVAIAGAVALVATGCGSKPTDNPTTSASVAAPSSSAASSSAPATDASSSGAQAGGALKACMVLDVGGVDDRSFNQAAWQGMQAAKAKNDKVDISYISSASQNDYTPNLNAEVSKGCDTVIAVGGLMTDAVKAVADKNPNDKFAIIDSNTGQPNVTGLEFNTAQGAFLGGYLAAGMSKTGKVATFGGLNIPPVTVYMDGFWEGVQYYNKQKNKNVQVLGWDEKNQKGGTFAQSFTDQGKGKSISQSFVSQGADVIFPVAGGTGLGAGAAAQASGGKVSVLWVDLDGCTSTPQYCQYFVSSVVKNIPDAVEKYVLEAADGQFPSEPYIGTLENNGTGLAPYHQYDNKVPAELKKEIDQLKQDIIGGKVSITSPSQPK
ncbi:MAG: BMP family lipoprotein [Actinomycetales bacterium]